MLDIKVEPICVTEYGTEPDTFVVRVNAGADLLPAAEAIRKALVEAVNDFWSKRHCDNSPFGRPCGDFHGERLEVFSVDEDLPIQFIWGRTCVELDIRADGFEMAMYVSKDAEANYDPEGTLPDEWGNELPPTWWVHPAYTIRRLLGIGGAA
jgi:hypothetical protein